MKILHVIANVATRYGGTSQTCLELAAATAKLGHDVHVFTTNMDGPDVLDVSLGVPVDHNGAKVTYFPVHFPRFWATSIPMARALRKTIVSFDVVHIHSLYFFHDLVVGYYCKKFNVPYLLKPHGSLDPYIFHHHRFRKRLMEVLFQDWVTRGAAAFHFITEEEKKLAAPFSFNVPGVVVSSGLNASDYENLPSEGSFQKRYPELAGKKIVLFFGRINFKKGLDILVKAFGTLARNRDDVFLVVAGPDGGIEDDVRGWLRAEGVLDRTIFTGMLTDTDKLAVLADSDLFVLPSYTENFGIAVIEAMICGTPVLISNKVNIWREVEASGAGYVTPCDSDIFAKRMIEMLDGPKAMSLMGEKGKKFVRDQFDWSNISLVMQNVYRAVAEDSLPDFAGAKKDPPLCLDCGGGLKPVLDGVWDTRFGIEKPFDIGQCQSCKLEQIFPLPESEKLSAYYAQHYNFGGERETLYTLIRKLFLGSAFYRLWMVIDGDISFHSEKGRGRLIDIGCNEGRGLDQYRRGGFQVEGLETNPVAAEVARAAGYTVNTGELSLFTPDATYDVVVLSNVLEHALDPADMLVHIKRILKPGGEVWISCPNGKSWLRSVFGRKWINWHVPFHIVQFTDKTLFQLLEKNGFTAVSSHQVTPVLWVAQTIISALFSKPKTATKQLRNPILVMTMMLVLQGVGFPLLWLENKLGRGDCLVVKARKV